jgi:hypothetical protein
MRMGLSCNAVKGASESEICLCEVMRCDETNVRTWHMLDKVCRGRVRPCEKEQYVRASHEKRHT